ncbi:MAG: response regulator [Candidatus Thermoplasmatota archaeon]|nr:response regulator [Candidatus Thermoplasmatota archaeon]
MSKQKVMVVDDEKNVLDLVGMILEAEGYEVSKANDGIECLDTIDEVNPDLVLLDVRMPGMNGWIVFEKLKENPRTKDIPVAMLTVMAHPRDRERALNELGVDDYITKPFAPDDLVRRVKKLLSP